MDDEKRRQDPDRELVAEVLAGDELAFERLVRRYQPRVFRLVHGILGDWQHAEDVCQEIFVNIYLKLSGFRFRSRLSTWIYRVAVHHALKRRAREARREAISIDKGILTGVMAPAREDESRAKLEGRDLMEKILRPLPDNLRTAVLLKEQEGLTYREIAEVLGCTQGVVEQRLYRAFVALREIWGGRLAQLGLEE